MARSEASLGHWFTRSITSKSDMLENGLTFPVVFPEALSGMVATGKSVQGGWGIGGFARLGGENYGAWTIGGDSFAEKGRQLMKGSSSLGYFGTWG